MPRRNHLSSHPPSAVEGSIKKIGANLRRARLRRNITIAEMADRLGVGRHVVMDAEGGKITTGIAVYVGMLWVFNMLEKFEAVTSPSLDLEGMSLASLEERERARHAGVDDDF